MTDAGSTLYATDGSFTLEKLDDRAIPYAPDEVRVFIIARNEFTALPFLLAYYRKLGVQRFFIVDNGSDDGTRDYVLVQPDTHVFTPSNSFKESNCGNEWQNLLLNTYGAGQWTLVVDADELLIYPHCEIASLPAFCRYLDRQGHSSLFVFMLDMYPDKNLSQAVYVSGQPFYDVCSFFDSTYAFSTRSSDMADGRISFPPQKVIGGPRLRTFYAWQKRTDILSRAAFKLLVLFADKIGYWKKDKPHYAPALIKAPLVKWHKGCRRLSPHTITPLAPSAIAGETGALLHFEFFASFHNKAKQEAARGQHFGGGLEYRRYLTCIGKNPDISFMYEGSRRYQNSDSVLQAGLIRTTDAWDEAAKTFLKG